MTAGPAPVPAAGHRRIPRVVAVLLAALLLLFSAITIVQSAAAHQITLGSFNTGALAVVGGALEPAHLGVWVAEDER